MKAERYINTEDGQWFLRQCRLIGKENYWAILAECRDEKKYIKKQGIDIKISALFSALMEAI